MLVRLILWALFGFLIYTVVQAAWQAFHRPRPTPPPEKSRACAPEGATARRRGGEAMERDPQCGTYVPRGDAVTAIVHGKEQWFCSTRCRDEFIKTNRSS